MTSQPTPADLAFRARFGAPASERIVDLRSEAEGLADAWRSAQIERLPDGRYRVRRA